MSEVTQSSGQRLRRERERKGLSSQKAADLLRLDPWVIDALEKDDYARLGPSVYGKGHLKRYGDLLGLPAAEMLESYEKRAATESTAPTVSRAPIRDPAGRPWATIATVAVALIAGFLLWRRPWQGLAPTSAAVPTANAPAAPPTQAAHAASIDAPVVSGDVGSDGSDLTLKEGSMASREAGSGAAAPLAEGTRIAAGAGKARLRLSFSSDSWVDVLDASGRRLFSGYGRANSVKSLAGAGPLKVYLGFANGVQLEVNERAVAIGPQFLAGDAARFEAGADGVLRRDSHVSTATNPHPRG